MTGWRDSVEEHREAMEQWADSDLPLSDEFAQLLEEYDAQAEARPNP